MKQTFLATTVVLTSLCFAATVRAENPDHVKRLLENKECRGCDLRGANLSGANLTFAILVNADLRGANLKGANLSNADLTNANLSQADFSRANLNQAYLTNANLDRTRLVGASLRNTKGLPILIASPPSLLSPALLPPLPRLKIPQLSSVIKIPPASRVSAQPLPPLTPLPRQIPVQAPRPVAALPQADNVYPPQVVEAFMTGCTKGNEAGMKQLCACMIDKAQRQYTLQEFLEISFGLADGEKPPERFTEIATECAVQQQAAFATNPQLTEARQYFQKRWQPPSDLKASLEYSLLLNANGSIQRIIPLGNAARKYIDQAGIPLIGEQFVSPNNNGQTTKIRVILTPDGKVQTFQEIE